MGNSVWTRIMQLLIELNHRTIRIKQEQNTIETNQYRKLIDPFSRER